MKHIYKGAPLKGAFLVLLFMLITTVSGWAQLSGTYTIDPGSSASSTNYQSFDAAVGDLISGSRSDGGSANGSGVSGAVIFNVADGAYDEQMEISAISGASSSYTITFQGASGDSSKVHLYKDAYDMSNTTYLNYVIQLNGCEWVNFKDMSIEVTNGSGNYYGTCVRIDGGSNNNSFTSCQIRGTEDQSWSTYDAAITSDWGYQDTGNHFTYCGIHRGAYYGCINLYGAYSTSYQDVFYFDHCDIDSNPMYYNIQANYTQLHVTNSNIGATGYPYGMNIYLQYCRSSIITGNRIGDNYYPVYLYDAGGISSKHCKIANNFITSGAGYSYSYCSVYLGSSTYTDLVYNNIYYEASYGYYSAVNVSSSSTGSIIKNNNIVTNYGNKIYDIYPTMSSGSINYNNYYQVSSGSFGTYNSSTYSSFSSWKSGTSKDANSLNVDPSYNNTATNDLHINNTGLNAKGVVITGYTRDFDGDVRNTSTPDIGADEISPVSDDAGITDVDSPSTYCAGNSKAVYVHLKNAGLNTLTSATIKWWFNGTAQTDYVYSGSLASGSNTSVMVGTKTFSGSSNTVAAKVTNPNGGADGNAANDSVSSTLGASLSGSKTIGGSSPDYATFALAVAALNANGVCGAVTFNVRNGSYTESITLDPIQGASATNTITFQSQSLDSTKVTLQNGSTVITLNGADFVTFQKMTIKQTSGSYTIEFKGGAHKNKILNNRIYNYQYGQGLYEGGSSLDTGNLISNNVIKYGYAIYFYGSYSSHSFGNTFTYNQIDSAYYYAILCINQDRLTIDHNTVTNFPYYGVLLEYCDTRLRVTNNNINTPIGCYAGLYLYDNTCTSGIKGLIANNTIAIVPGSYNGYGINMAYNSYLQVVYNNVNIYSATATSSAALYSYSYGGGNNVLYNNNFVNNSNGYAMYVGVTSYFSAINYNNLYTSGSNLTYYGGSAYSDLASHQSGSGVDANSVSVDPLYTSNTNLHVFNAALNGTATPITDVTTDMDGTTRNATTPDIGSDEFTPPADDAGITSIDSPSNYCGGTSYNIYVTLLNGGINTLTSASIKMKVNGGTASTYSYTGSLASGTSVSINIGSLSMAANTVYNLKVWSESPNGVADVNHVNDTTAVAKNSALNGSKTIGGSSPDFATFTAAVTALSSRGVCGATTFNVRDGSYNEYVTIPAITGASATNTITFQSQSLDSTKVTLYRSGSATSPNYVVGLVGAEYIIFNKMTIMRQAASYVSTEVVRLISGASHNTFKNSILKGITSSYNYGYVVFDDYSSLDSANTFNNNIIRGGYYTMYLQGNYSTHEVGYRITNNTIDSSYYYQIYCVYQNDLTITGNKITNKLSSYGYAIMMQYVTDNTYIRNNKIDLPTGGYGIYLNYYCSPASGTGKITNNMIAINGINYNAYGIYAYYSQNWDIYYNNINIYNTSSYNANGYCLYNYYYYSANNWNIKNNNLVNTNRGYALYSYYYYSPVFTSCNYNNLYNAGGGSYALVSYNGSTYYTLSSWQSSGSGYDANSVSMDPTFTSNTDLHTSAAGIKKKGTPISGLTTDYDGEFRNALKPTIGADEPTPSPYDAVITAYITPVANYCVGTNNVTITLTNNGSVTLVSDSIAWSVNGTTQTPYQWTGSLAAGSSSNITLGTYSFVSGVYNVVATSYKPNGNSDNDNSNDTLSSVNLKAALSGTKTIGGSSPTYSTFALAVADLTTYGVCAPLIFNVRDGSYNQRISIGNVPGASAINTVTFQSQSLDSTKVNLYNSTSNSASNITLNGCDFVKFSKMTIQRTGSVYGSYGTLVTIQNTSTNNTFSHCRIIGVKSPYYYSSFYNIYKYGTTDDSANTFDQNSITNGSYSFHYYNYSGSTNGLVIKNNYIDSVRTYGLYCYYINNINMTGNYLRVLANGSSDYSNTYGLYLQYCNTITAISKNKIFVETGYYGGNGMYFYYGNGSSSLISNNWISTTTTSTYSYLNYANIYCYFSKGNFFYNNSLYSNMGASSTYQANFYMYDYNSGNNTRFVNNINVNTSSTGQVMFVYYTYYMGQMDYNDFWQPNGGSFGMCNYSTTADLSTWKSYSGKEASSISKDPKYVSATNLHAKGIGINNKGVSYSGVTTDIDGETRGTTPDIGSDEFTPDSLDMAVTLNSPSVNFCLGTQNVVVTLTNQGLSTVTSENIAWSVNGSAQTPYSWTGSLAVGQSSNVTIGTYTYSTGNVYNVAFTISLPNGLTDGEPANDTISAVNVKEALTGTKTIGGSSPDYATFTAAAAALNTFGVCGAVVFNVRDGSYNEYITLNAIAGTSATNTITFQSQSLDYTKVSLNYATGSSIYVVTLNGADFVTFNKMTIERTGSGSNYYGAVIQIMNGANNNNFTYNRIRSVYPSYEYFPHYLVYSAGTNDTANHFTNNIMRNGQGFYWFGASSGSQESGTVISNNDMDSITQNQFYYHKNMTISNNIMKVMNVNYTSTSMYGINMYYVDKSNISYNKISLTGSPDYENCGIYMYYCASSSTKAVNIFNNFISVGGSSSYYTTYGIYDNYYNNYVNMYYNNINVYGASNSIGLYIYYNAGANNAENNNIVNTGGGQAVSMYGYSGIGTVDYNNYYITGSTFGDWQYTSQSSFSDWQSNTGNDANGQNVDPGYTSNTDLHVSAPTLDGAATVITSITDDIDGTTRHTSTPDIGADEFAVATDDAGITGLANTPCAGSQNINVTLKNFGLTTLTSATIYYSINGATPSSYSWTGSLVSGTSASVTVGTYTFSSSSTYTFKSYSTVPNGVTDGNHANDTFYNGSLQTSLGGTYTIGGTSPSFATFTLAATALNTRGLCAAAIFNVRDGAYNEKISLSAITGSSASKTVTFQSQSGDSSKVSIYYIGSTSSTNDYVVELDGADYVTFKDLTINRSNGGSLSNYYYYRTAVKVSGGANHNKFINNRLISENNYYYYAGDAVISGGGYDDLLIQGNHISGGYYSIYLQGGYYSHDNNLRILDNEIDSSYNGGVYPYYSDSFRMDNNKMRYCQNSSWAIYPYYCNDMVSVSNNKISFDNGGYGIYTYYCQNYTAPCLVANNMIYMGGSYSTNYGIYNYYYSYGFLWLNNTYHSESYYGAAVYMYYGNQGNTFYNNNFSLPYANTMYDMLYEYSSDIDSMNYNNYYTNGSGAYFNFYYSNYYDLSSWQSAYGFDANSVEIDPIFTSTTAGSDNLHITNCALKSLGLDISTYVSTDIDGTVRDTRPDMGADEDIAGTPGIWTGSYNTVWMNVDNWCGGGLPGATDNVTLNSGLPNYPVITTGNGICNDYTISSGASTTMSGGKLTVYGTFTQSGSWTATGGTTEFAKTSGTQAIPAISFLSLETSGGATKTMSADLTVDQTLTNNSTLSIGAGNKLSINGNYIGTGGITGSTTSKVAVGGGGVAPHITLPSMTLSNLTIARHNGVTISSGNLNIQDSIDMLGGILFTDTVSFSNKIVLASGGNLNESDTSYIWGTIEQTKNVPLSTDVNFGDMGVTINAATTSPGSTVVTRKQNVISGLTGHNGQAVKGFKTTWDIVPTTNTNLGATLTMHYNGAFLNNIVETSLDLFVDHGSGWDHAGLVSINTTANTITSRPQSHFSNFTLGGSFSNPLPVELISFNASLKNEVTAALVWKTASEIDNNHFDVERSVDGTTFLKVGEVAGHGTTNMESSYGFDDQFGNVLSPVLYYRLKQVDNNGTFTYSNIAKVRTTERVDGLKVWYNQGTDKIATIISVNTADKVTLKVTDQTGKVVGEQTTSVSKGNNVLELDMTGNAKGIYNFIYTSGAGTQVRRVIKY